MTKSTKYETVVVCEEDGSSGKVILEERLQQQPNDDDDDENEIEKLSTYRSSSDSSSRSLILLGTLVVALCLVSFILLKSSSSSSSSLSSTPTMPVDWGMGDGMVMDNNDDEDPQGNFSAVPPGDFCLSSVPHTTATTSNMCMERAQYVTPLPIPKVIDGRQGGFVTITAQKACHQVFYNADGSPCGPPTEIWGYDGTWPGPTIVTSTNVPFSIQHINHMGSDSAGNNISITTHHHGLHLPPEYDGHPMADSVTDVVSFGINPAAMMYPGYNYTYEIPNDQEPGTHWYHDHMMHATGRNIIMGLAGFFLVQPNPNDPKYTNVLDLPSGDYEIGLVIQDRTFTKDNNNNNQMDYPMQHSELIQSGLVHAGFRGDTMLVNGVYAPYVSVKRGWYRFRLLNGCNARHLTLQLQTKDGQPVLKNDNDNDDNDNILFQIGTEGGFIAQRTARSEIYMAPGERYDVLIDFRAFAIGTEIYLRNTYTDHGPKLPDVLQFRIVQGTTPMFNIPTSLLSYYNTFPSPDNVVRTRTIGLVAQQSETIMNKGGDGKETAWTIGGMNYDPNVANIQVRKGDTERWIFSATGMSMHHHPMHLHLVQFHIEGVEPGSLQDGWKDTVVVSHTEEQSILVTFNGEPGIYMFHCHNLEHEDWDMMLQYSICDDDSEQHPCDENLLQAFTNPDGLGGRADENI